MEKLSFQDAAFLRMESPRRPFHVAGLMVLSLPDDAPANYLRRLARQCGKLNRLWPVFNKRLQDPDDLSQPGWVEADDYDPQSHVLHYALPPPGRMDDLLALVSLAHERPLDRGRPLWELHIIEGLSGDRFAVYCKVHHALVDGVGALRMIEGLFSNDPDARLRFGPERKRTGTDAPPLPRRGRMLASLGGLSRAVLEQYQAMPQLSALLSHMGMDALQGKQDVMKLPFTAPRTVFNGEVTACRRVVICDLSLRSVRQLAHRQGGTVNDVLLSVCGGALRDYLDDLKALPRRSLVAGLPVSLKRDGDEAGNQLSFILSPFCTDEPDPLRRLERVIRVTSSAKRELAGVSPAASQDLANLMLIPTLLLTLSGNATRARPAINAIFSNVPGPTGPLYLEGARLQALYPFSVVTDGMAINLTVVSYAGKLCFAVTTCPQQLPGVERLGALLKSNFAALRDASIQATR